MDRRPSAKEHICYYGKLPTESETDNTVFGIGNRETRESHSSGLYSVDDILDIMNQFRKLEPSKYPEPFHTHRDEYTYEDIQNIADILNDTLYEIQDDERKPYEPDAEGEQLDELELCKGNLEKRARFFFDYLARQDARNNLDNVNENVEFKYEYIPQLRTHPLWSVITRESDIPLDQSSLELHRLSSTSSPISPSWGSPIRSAESSVSSTPQSSPRRRLEFTGGSKKQKTIKKRSGRKVGGSKKKKSSPKPKTKISNKNKRSKRTRRNNKKGGGLVSSKLYKNDIEKLQTDISLFKQFISNSQSEAKKLKDEISKKEKKCPKVKGRPVECYNMPIDELKINAILKICLQKTKIVKRKEIVI